ASRPRPGPGTFHHGPIEATASGPPERRQDPSSARSPPPRRSTMSTLKTAEQIQHEWNTDPRWAGIIRNYTAEDVVRLRGTIPVEHSIARITSEKLWRYLHEMDFVNALGA